MPGEFEPSVRRAGPILQGLCYNLPCVGRQKVLDGSMKLDQDAKSMIAVMALVGAIALALNAVVLPGGDRDMFSWSVGFLAVAILFWIWMRRDALAEKSADAVKAAQEAANQAEALAKRTEVRRAAEPDEAVEPDDLRKINGIGAIYLRVLNEAGLHTYAQIAAASTEELEAVFSEAQRNRPPRLETWSPQAALAEKADWEGLRRYQDSM